MSIGEKKNSKVITYLPAMLKYTKHGWTIEYSVINPETMLMQRQVMKMNRIRKRYAKLNDFKSHCLRITMEINGKLASGWTPFEGSTVDSRQLTSMSFVLDDYIKEKSIELRPDTIINYRSFVKMFKEWVEKNYGQIAVSSFSRLMAVRFMDFVLKEKGLKGRSYNNRLKQARAFFSYAVEKYYCVENPFSSIKTKREETKKRILIPSDSRKLIYQYWEKKNPNYITLCELVFTALIRPKECWRLQVADLRLSDYYIEVSEDDSKTHYRRSASLSPELVTRLIDMTRYAKPSDYLFGPGYSPGKKQMVYSRIRKDWQDMRNELGLPDEMQLYSLRDTGISEMLHAGIDPLSVMKHADHHSLGITTRYANHADPNLVETIKTKAPQF